jgi:hypothetical protein
LLLEGCHILFHLVEALLYGSIFRRKSDLLGIRIQLAINQALHHSCFLRVAGDMCILGFWLLLHLESRLLLLLLPKVILQHPFSAFGLDRC